MTITMNHPIGPFNDQPGVWLRSAFHVHTTESDGWLTPVIQRRYHAMAESLGFEGHVAWAEAM